MRNGVGRAEIRRLPRGRSTLRFSYVQTTQVVRTRSSATCADESGPDLRQALVCTRPARITIATSAATIAAIPQMRYSVA